MESLVWSRRRLRGRWPCSGAGKGVDATVGRFWRITHEIGEIFRYFGKGRHGALICRGRRGEHRIGARCAHLLPPTPKPNPLNKGAGPSQPTLVNFVSPFPTPTAFPPSSTTNDRQSTACTSSSPAFTQYRYRSHRPSSRSTSCVIWEFQPSTAAAWSTYSPAMSFPPKPKSSSPTAAKVSRSRDPLTLNRTISLGLLFCP